MQPVLAGEVTTMATLKTIAPVYAAPAQVQPVAPLHVDAQIGGQVTDLPLAIGQIVAPGQVLAHIAGAKAAADTARLRAQLGTAQADQAAARQVLSATQQRFAQRLATRDDLARAQAAMKTAALATDAASHAVTAQRTLASITSPVRAEVAELLAAQGQTVQPGQHLVTLWPTEKLEIHAAFYGAPARAVQSGMAGQFRADGAAVPIAVTIRHMRWSLSQPGRLDVWLASANGKPLPLGLGGEVALQPASRPWPAVPSTALILDQGQWWVMVHDAAGDHRRQVTPGASENGWTAVYNGLRPGEAVVTLNAYLIYHQDFAKRYQQAD